MFVTLKLDENLHWNFLQIWINNSGRGASVCTKLTSPFTVSELIICVNCESTQKVMQYCTDSKSGGHHSMTWGKSSVFSLSWNMICVNGGQSDVFRRPQYSGSSKNLRKRMEVHRSCTPRAPDLHNELQLAARITKWKTKLKTNVKKKT